MIKPLSKNSAITLKVSEPTNICEINPLTVCISVLIAANNGTECNFRIVYL